MADTTSLTSFLDDVASAIKYKKGDNTAIPAANFDTEIRNLPSQGTYEEKSVTITQNGTQNVVPDSGYDALSRVSITTAVPEKQLQTKSSTITDNGTIELHPDTGYDGFDQVNLTINVSGGGEVKKFISKAAMDASSGNEEGDLAIVYGSSTQSVTEDTEFSSCTFPSTVVLSEAFSDNIYGSFRSTNQGSYFSGMVELSASRFRFDGYGDTNVRVQYTSGDGITYTRTDGGAELQEFGTTIKWKSYGDPFNSVIGNFMKIQSSDFQGLFEYQSKTIENQYNALFEDEVLHIDYVNPEGLSDLRKTKHIIIPLTIDTNNYITSWVIYPVSTNNGASIRVDLSTNKVYLYSTQTLVAAESRYYTYQNGSYSYTDAPYNTANTNQVLYTTNNIRYITGNVDIYDTSGNKLKDAADGITFYSYDYAPSQLNLNNANQLLTGVKGYGKDGVVTGDESIYNNLDKNMINNNIFNLDYIEANNGDHFYAGLPTRYCCDNKEAGKIKFYKSLTVDTPAVHWVGSVDIPQTYIYTPRSGYSFQQLLKNEKHKLVISILYPSSGNWICQIEDAVTHTILHTESFSVTDYVKAGMGEDFVYLFFVSSSTAYVDKINLSTYTKTRVESFNFAVANQRSVDIRTNGPYVSYMYYGRNDKVSKCHVSLIDEVTNRVITVRDTETLTTTSTSHEYKLALVNNPTYLYIGSSMGAVGTRSYKLHRIAKADDTVTLLGTGSVNGAYISDFSDANVYEDNNYIYTKNVAVSKNESSLSSHNYISTGTSLIDMNGDPITTYGTGLYPLGIKYRNDKMYAVFRPFICEIDSFVTTINDGYMSFVYTCKNFFPFVNEGLIYSLIPNANMPNNAQLVYSQLDMSTFIALDNKTYKFNFNNTHTNTNELEGTITFTPCVISDSLDYDYGCIYNQHNGPAGNIKNDNFIFANFNANHPLVNYDDIGTISPAETTQAEE